MTKNITLRMDEDQLRNLKHIAVEHDMSVSAWITQTVLDAAKKEADVEAEVKRLEYEKAKSFILKAMENPGHYGGRKFSREEMHERRHISGQ